MPPPEPATHVYIYRKGDAQGLSLLQMIWGSEETMMFEIDKSDYSPSSM